MIDAGKVARLAVVKHAIRAAYGNVAIARDRDGADAISATLRSKLTDIARALTAAEEMATDELRAAMTAGDAGDADTTRR